MPQFQSLIKELGRSTSLVAGNHLFRQGDRDSNVYFVEAGLLKAYYIRADGKEHIKSFQPDGSVIGSMVALIDREPCTFSLVAAEPSRVISLPFEQLESAARGDLSLANALIDLLSTYGKRKERREYELLSLSPEDRYQVFLETMPDVAQRISQADTAAYVGVTPQALSRIKRRMSKIG